jgi:transposase
MRRYELTDEQWAVIEPLLPKAERGRPLTAPRQMLNAMFWVLRSGAPWRDLPERFGPWQTVYHHFNSWRRRGVYERILEALQVRLDAEGQIDWDLWCVDGTMVRASRSAAGAGKKGAPTSPPTTHWAARAADSGASSTWSLTATAFPSRCTSPRARSTSARSSKQS